MRGINDKIVSTPDGVMMLLHYEYYPSGEWGYTYGEYGDEGLFIPNGRQSKVFLFNTWDECVDDMELTYEWLKKDDTVV